MITEFSVQNFGCLGDVNIAMTPIHALVGPNDSGKTTVLRALESAIRWMARGVASYQEYFTGKTLGFMVHHPHSEPWRASISEEDHQTRQEKKNKIRVRRPIVGRPKWLSRLPENYKYTVIRWEPDQLKQPSALIPLELQEVFLSNRGQGLPGIYDAILSRGDDAYQKISKRFCELFPGVARISLPAVSGNQKTIEIVLKNGQKIRPAQMSEGMLYFLAFAALQYIERLDLIMLEEPENGLHPARIREVMNILKDLAKNGTQVLLTTHSPLVLNELEANQVTVLWRRDGEGARSTLMSKTADFEKRSEVFSLAELWLNYCNGIDEKPLIEGPTP